jgi:hypothetical protein
MKKTSFAGECSLAMLKAYKQSLVDGEEYGVTHQTR